MDDTLDASVTLAAIVDEIKALGATEMLTIIIFLVMAWTITSICVMPRAFSWWRPSTSELNRRCGRERQKRMMNVFIAFR